MDAKIKKILVTGSKGFVGSHLMEILGDLGLDFDIKTDNDILNLDQLEYYFKEYKITHVIHLAAISNRQDTDRNPQLALQTNIIGTYNVLSMAKKYKARVVLASSAATAEPKLSLYGMSKNCMENLASMFDDVVTVRFYNVYGPRSKSVVNKFIRKIKRGEVITLNGNTVRDYVYVTDVVAGLLELTQPHWRGRVYELGTGKGTTLKNLAKMIARLTGKDLKYKQLKPIKEIQESKMNKRHGFFKPVTLEQGIRRLI